MGRVEDESGPPIALLSAPAGFGKTTLLSQYCQEVTEADRANVAWVSLDSSGSYVGSVWRAILSAIEASSPTAAGVMTGLLHPRRPPDGDFLRRFLAQAGELADPTILVLDDVQDMTDPNTVHQFGTLCRQLPRPLRLVVSSRHDPAFSLHEARLAGNLVEARAAHLAFSPAETGEVLRDLPLDTSDVDAVVRLTEGWPAGVQLARSVLRRPGDGSRLAALFETKAGVLADYLFEESFTATSAEAQDILLRTSVVEQFNDDLAVDLAGRVDAGAAISTMTDLAPLLNRFDGPDGGVAWYRYHPLLRSYLVAELTRRDRTLLRDSHRRAASWFATHNDALTSVRHALASEDTDLIDAILLQLGPGLLLSGEGEQLRHELSQHHSATGWMSILNSCAAAQTGSTAVARRWLAEADAVADESDRRLSELRSAVQRRVDHLSGTPLRSSQPEPTTSSQRVDDLQLLISLTRGSTWLGAGEIDAAERELERAVSLATTLGRPLADLQSRTLRAAIALHRGEYLETATRVQEVRSRAAELDSPHEPILAYLDVLLGWTAFEHLDDDVAARHLDQVGDGIRGMLDPTIESAAHSQAKLLATALRVDSRGDPGSQPEAWVPYLEGSLPPSQLVYACFAYIRHALGAGRSDLIRVAVRKAEEHLAGSGDLVTMKALILSAQHRDRAAARPLGPILQQEVKCLVRSSLIQALLIDATSAVRTDCSFRAFDDLRRALAVCEQTGAYRTLATCAPDLLAYLAEQADRLDEHQELVGRVVTYARHPTRMHRIAQLTERELDVLRELPTLNHVDEIAANLMVSTNTVKSHIRAIYRKLEVGSRSEAVRAARRRGLL